MTHLDHFSQLLLQHGEIALFVLLALGIVGLPIPDETLLVTAGFLIARGKLSLVPTLLYADLGSICGISLSYCIGRFAGHWLIRRCGRWVGITPAHLERAHNWFQKFGAWALPISYFIPGLRHLLGYLAGTLELDFKKFALFAYCGAVFWVSTFISVGYILAQQKTFTHLF